MKKALFTLAAVLVPITMFATPSPQKPGKWEITTKMEMPGMNMKLPANTITRCLTKEDTADMEKSLPRGTRDNGNCKVLDMNRDGNTVTWKVECKGDHPVTGTGKITYASENFDGTMNMKMGDREMNLSYAGKYVGECDGTEAPKGQQKK